MLFDAYKVAVRVSMINQVSPVLSSLSRQFSRTGHEVDHLQKKLDRIKLLGMTGAAVGGPASWGLACSARW